MACSSMLAATLIIENCRIYGFSQNGININANTASTVRVAVTDTVASNSAGGIAAKNASTGRVTVSATRESAQEQQLRNQG